MRDGTRESFIKNAEEEEDRKREKMRTYEK
jgi:hypothetical protein